MQFTPSPHHNARPQDAEINLIVLHAISLPLSRFEPGAVSDFFRGALDTGQHPEVESLKEMCVSAHFVVDRKGNTVQFVPLSRRAWHAGDSSWEERENCNDYSIGIEMIGDETEPFTQAQYRETARVCKVLINMFPAISRSRIVGHQDIAPGRKWDPGKMWDWQKFQRSFSSVRKLNLQLKR